jgi:ubiquinone/menaquinone biosynthesis C-methylase UbiE
LFEVLVREGDLRGQRVLEVGCGTGTLASALAEKELCKVWAIDREPAMVEIAKGRIPRGSQARVADAEQLPFKDGWFDRAVMRLVAHHLDRGAAFPELARVLVPGGRVVVATLDPDDFADRWFNRFLPQLLDRDRGRFMKPAVLEHELRAAGFARTSRVEHEEVERWPKEVALAKLEGRYISTLQWASDEEIADAVERARAELPDEVTTLLRWHVVVAER